MILISFCNLIDNIDISYNIINHFIDGISYMLFIIDKGCYGNKTPLIDLSPIIDHLQKTFPHPISSFPY